MIDVGQGDSILLSSKGHHILVDTGGQIKLEKELWKKQKRQYSIVRTKTIPLLKSLGIKKIDNLILTHGDMDHLGEATILLDNFQVENIILNLGTLNQKEQEIKKKYKKVTQIKQDQEITCGEIKLIQLNKEFKEENESSQIYYAKYKQRKILLMADAEEKSENYILNTYNLEPIDILKVSHHGSKYSTIEPFLKIIHPKISLISVGENNQFSHPHKELIARLKKYQTKIYQTKQSGNITINLDNLKVTEEKPTE